MTLQELWDKMVPAASAQDQVIAGVYAPYITELSDDLGDLYEPQEYPKWVGDKVVHSADEERALTAEPEAPAQLPAAPDETAPVDPTSSPAAPAADATDASAAGETPSENAPAAEGGAQ